MRKNDTTREEWATMVGRVFNVMPRNGNDKGTVWLERRMQQKFNSFLRLAGVHICVDGPTGSGKSSLAVTELNRAGIKYAMVQITNHTTWEEFCRSLVTIPERFETSGSAQLEAGTIAGIPMGRFRVSLGFRDRQSRGGEREKMSYGWTEQDVCKQMVKDDTILFLDDFEKANEEIVVRVADMCKLLTQTHIGRNAKLVVVGTGNIHSRILGADRSLRERLEEVGVGVFRSPGESWRFLQLGFVKLRLRHPEMESFIALEEKQECRRAVNEAADGLPKMLNKLGHQISLKGYQRNRISPSDIIGSAEGMLQDNFQSLHSDFPQLMELAQSDPIVKAVLHKLYELGIGEIHSWSKVVHPLRGKFGEDETEYAIRKLVNGGFITDMRPVGDTLFVNDVGLFHALCIVSENPARFGEKEEKYASMGQLPLPLGLDNGANGAC